MDWYALFVTTGREENVVERLGVYFKESEFVSLVPKRALIEYKAGRKQKLIKKLFPGYVLVNTVMDPRIYYKLKNIPDLIRILSCGEYYTKIPEEEMTDIRRLLGEGDVVDCSQVYLVDSKVVVKSGPLQGYEGLIRKVDKRKQRIKIVMNFMGVPKEIDLGIEVLKLEAE